MKHKEINSPSGWVAEHYCLTDKECALIHYNYTSIKNTGWKFDLYRTETINRTIMRSYD